MGLLGGIFRGLFSIETLIIPVGVVIAILIFSGVSLVAVGSWISNNFLLVLVIFAFWMLFQVVRGKK